MAGKKWRDAHKTVHACTFLCAFCYKFSDKSGQGLLKKKGTAIASIVTVHGSKFMVQG